MQQIYIDTLIDTLKADPLLKKDFGDRVVYLNFINPPVLPGIAIEPDTEEENGGITTCNVTFAVVGGKNTTKSEIKALSDVLSTKLVYVNTQLGEWYIYLTQDQSEGTIYQGVGKNWIATRVVKFFY